MILSRKFPRAQEQLDDIILLFEQARALIQNKETWVKHHYALSYRGKPIDVHAANATQFSMLGAIHRYLVDYTKVERRPATWDDFWYHILTEAIEEEFRGRTVLRVSSWEDERYRIHSDVIRVLDRAIQLTKDFPARLMNDL